MQIPPPKKKPPHQYLFTPWQHSCTYTFFHNACFYSKEGCIHEHSICSFSFLYHVYHTESDYRHIPRSICRIIATIYVRRLDANRSTEKTYSRVRDGERPRLIVCYSPNVKHRTDIARPSVSIRSPNTAESCTNNYSIAITQLIKMHRMTVSIIREMFDLGLNVNLPDLLKELLTWQIKLYASSSSI